MNTLFYIAIAAVVFIVAPPIGAPVAIFCLILAALDKGHSAATEAIEEHVSYGNAGMVFVVTLVATMVLLFAVVGATVSVMEKTEPGSSKPFADFVLELASPD